MLDVLDMQDTDNEISLYPGRGKHRINRREYLVNPSIYCKRGTELAHSKLDDNDVRLILDAVEERDRLRKEANMLSNKSLADKFGVHCRTIDRITQNKAWNHI